MRVAVPELDWKRGGCGERTWRGGKDNMVKRNIGLWRMPVEPQGDEGRDKLRKATERSTYPVIRGCPNGVTHVRRRTYREGE